MLNQPRKKQQLTNMLKANEKTECLSKEMESLSKETEDINIPNRIFRTEKYKNWNKLLTTCAQEQHVGDREKNQWIGTIEITKSEQQRKQTEKEK